MSAIALIILLAHSYQPPACGLAQMFGRPEIKFSLIVTARRDSIEDVANHKETPDESVALRKEKVYGQIGVISKSTGHLPAGYRIGGKVVFVWWNQDDACRRYYIGPSIQMDPGSEAYISAEPRPVEKWIAGLPTYDIYWTQVWTYDFYAPSMIGAGRPETLAGKMSARELGEFLFRVPTSKDLEKSDSKRNQFLEWASRHPETARLYPANILVDIAPSLSQRFRSRK